MVTNGIRNAGPDVKRMSFRVLAALVILGLATLANTGGANAAGVKTADVNAGGAAMLQIAKNAPDAATMSKPAVPARPAPVTLDRQQRRAFEKVIREYILNHPEIVTQAVQLSRARQEARERNALRQSISTRSSELSDDAAAPMRGNPDGDVTIVEFMDFRCPYCRRAIPILETTLSRDSNIRLVYKDMPILGEESNLAARAALAAHKQNGYVKFHDALYERQRTMSFTETNLLDLAAELGLDAKKLKVDMYETDVNDQIARNLRLANSLGISGTPTFIVGDKIIPGLTTVRQLLDAVDEDREGRAQIGAK